MISEVRYTWTAVRNICLFESLLFTRRKDGLLDSQSWYEGELGKGCKGMTDCSCSKQWSSLALASFSEHPIIQSGQFGEGRGYKGWTTDGDGWRSGSLSASVRGEQMLYRKGHTAAQSAGSGGKCGGERKCTQPCLPRGPPCLRRQDPSSVSKAIFTNAWKLLLLSLRLSCEGMKHRQIPSLGTRQSQHLISTLCGRQGIYCSVPNHRRPMASIYIQYIYFLSVCFVPGKHVVYAQFWLSELK